MGISVNNSKNSNIYAFNAASALAACPQHAEGTPNATLAVISERTLPAEARSALESSAERLGFGRDNVLWVTCEDGNGRSLDATDLQELLVGCDPLAFVAADAAAARQLGDAFSAACAVDAAGRLEGRNLVAFASFPAMLGSPEEKQRAWALLKKLA